MPRLISLFDIRPLLEPLTSGQLVLTPNQRLASRICASYTIHCTESGDYSVVDTPNVNALNSWIDNCWQQLIINAVPSALKYKVLSTTQEQALWERIISESELGAALLRPAATAQHVSGAYRTLVEWEQDTSSTDFQQIMAKDEDSDMLMQWINRFEMICAEQEWMPQVRRTEVIISAFCNGYLSNVGNIHAVAFETIAPLFLSLISTAGTFQTVEVGKKASSVVVSACESPQQELLAAAVWAKQILRDNEKATVGIVIPDLVQQRQVVQRTLQEIFESDFNHLTGSSSDPGAVNSQPIARKNLPFNLSAGYSLIEAPIICAALDCLSLQLSSVEIETLEQIVQSPFFGRDSGDEFVFDIDCKAQLIRLLRGERKFKLSSARFRQLAEKAAASVLFDNTDKTIAHWHFSELLQSQANFSRSASLNNSRSLSSWCDVFQSLLTGSDSGLGWPGNRQLDSIEYQQVSQWQLALEDFSNLQLVLETDGALLSYGEALSQLRSVLSRRIFQPQTIDSPLQVLGTLEAAGLQFTHLWLHSMSDHQWPPAPSPNPLLPKAFQRRLSMPHSSAERELLYAKNVSERFLNSSKKVVISYSEMNDNNKGHVSALFDQFPIKNIEEMLGTPLTNRIPINELRRRHYESAMIETIALDNAPQLNSEESIRGGSGLFASQSACPFRAFVSHRLGLQALDNPEIGLNAAERGSLLHRALELVWEKLKSKKQLMLQTAEDIDKLCKDTASYAVNELGLKSGRNSFGARFQLLEIRRLHKLLAAWLDVEKERSDFSVEAIELRKSFRFQQLELETRIDRIDRLSDNSLLVIDYKTGITNINRWWGDRPDEPQLPLYIMLMETGDKEQEQVNGIAFAQVRADGSNLKGVGGENSPEPMVQWHGKIQSDSGELDWAGLKKHWFKVLSALASDFIEGKADIDPKKALLSCQYCNFSSVCRINHRELSA